MFKLCGKNVQYLNNHAKLLTHTHTHTHTDPPAFTDLLSSGIVCEGTDSPYNCAIMEGSSGTLNCAADGNPPPEVSLTETTERVTLISDQVMVSTATDAENGVRVQCTASSGNYNISREFDLNVGSK